jgi:hypothetical protein
MVPYIIFLLLILIIYFLLKTKKKPKPIVNTKESRKTEFSHFYESGIGFDL